MPNFLVRWLARPSHALPLLFLSLAAGGLLGWWYTQPGFTPGWKTSQYFFNYQELGFIKRALVGTLLHPFPWLTTGPALVAIAGVFLATFAVVFSRFFFRCAAGLSAQAKAPLMLLCVTSPSLFLRLGYDYGRYDVLALFATIFSVQLIQRNRLFAASLCCTFVLLNHEGLIFLSLPLIAAFALGEEPFAWRCLRWRRWFVLFTVPGLATIVIALRGGYEPGLDALIGRFAQNEHYLAAVPQHEVDVSAISVLTRSLTDNLRYNADMFFVKRAPLHLAVIGVWFFFFVRYFSRFYADNGLTRDALFYAAFAPLLLSVMAIDYYRWIAFVTMNMMFVMLIQSERLARRGRPVAVAFDLNAKIIAASCLAGPISNTQSFPYAIALLKRLLSW